MEGETKSRRGIEGGKDVRLLYSRMALMEGETESRRGIEGGKDVRLLCSRMALISISDIFASPPTCVEARRVGYDDEVSSNGCL